MPSPSIEFVNLYNNSGNLGVSLTTANKRFLVKKSVNHKLTAENYFSDKNNHHGRFRKVKKEIKVHYKSQVFSFDEFYNHFKHEVKLKKTSLRTRLLELEVDGIITLDIESEILNHFERRKGGPTNFKISPIKLRLQNGNQEEFPNAARLWYFYPCGLKKRQFTNKLTKLRTSQKLKINEILFISEDKLSEWMKANESRLEQSEVENQIMKHQNKHNSKLVSCRGSEVASLKEISDLYKNNLTKMMFLCEFGHLYEKSFSKLGSQGCTKCSDMKAGASRRNELKDIERLLTKYNYSYDIHSIEKEYKNQNSKLELICPHGCQVKRSYAEIVRSSRCSHLNLSLGECLLQFVTIESMKIKFHKVRPKWLHRLEFDLFNDEYKIGIEFDGQYHYPELFDKDHKYRERAEKQKKKDMLKDELAIKNNVALLRISFKDILICNFDFRGVPNLNNNPCLNYADSAMEMYAILKNFLRNARPNVLDYMVDEDEFKKLSVNAFKFCQSHVSETKAERKSCQKFGKKIISIWFDSGVRWVSWQFVEHPEKIYKQTSSNFINHKKSRNKV